MTDKYTKLADITSSDDSTKTHSKSPTFRVVADEETKGTKIEEGIDVNQVDVKIPEEKKKFDVLSCKPNTSRNGCNKASAEQVKEALKQLEKGGHHRKRGGTKRKKSKRKKSKRRKSKRRKKSKKSKKAKKSKKSKRRRKSKKRRKSRRKSRRRR